MGNNNFKPTSFFTSFHGISRLQSFKTTLQVENCSNQDKYYCKSDSFKKKLQIEDLIHGSELKIILCK